MFRNYLSKSELNIEKGTRNLTLSMLPSNGIKKVLDIGSGNGVFTDMVLKRLNGVELTGMDISDSLAEKAIRNYNHHVVIADAGKQFPFKDSSFDLIIASQIVEHVYDTDLMVAEIYRVLKKNGICVCSTPNLASIHNIISLLFSRQPFTCHISDRVNTGTLFNDLHPEYLQPEFLGMRHRRIFTAKSLQGLFEYYGFITESLKGHGYYFAPSFINKRVTSPRYATYITLRVRK